MACPRRSSTLWIGLLYGTAASIPACQAPSPLTQPSASQPSARVARPLPPEMLDLVRAAAERYGRVRSYRAVLIRQERSQWGLPAPDVIAMRFRADPWSVHMEWVGGPHRRREALYVEGANGNSMYALMGDLPLSPLFALRPNNPLAKRFSRHPITEAGIGRLLQKLSQVVRNAQRGKYGTFRYAGLVRDSDGRELHQILQEPTGGGQRMWTIDRALGLPVGVCRTDRDGQLLNSYRYTRVELDPGLMDADFDPARLWPDRRPVVLGSAVPAGSADQPASLAVQRPAPECGTPGGTAGGLHNPFPKNVLHELQAGWHAVCGRTAVER